MHVQQAEIPHRDSGWLKVDFAILKMKLQVRRRNLPRMLFKSAATWVIVV